MTPQRQLTMFTFVIFLTQLILINSIVYDHNPIVVSRYDFTRENCINQKFPTNYKSISLDLYRNPNTTTCSSGLGIEATTTSNNNNKFVNNGMMTTTSQLVDTGTNTIKDFLKVFHNNGITIEIWMKPFPKSRNNDDQVYPILTFGTSPEKDIRVNGLTECSIQQVDLQVVQRRNYIEVIFSTADQYFEPCTYFRLVNLPINIDKINHLAISLGNNQQQFFINGKSSPILNEPFNDQLKHWNENDKIYLFSYPRRETIWYGRIYQILIHNGIFNETTIRSRLAIDFPKSIPYAISEKFTINEDAEIHPGSHNPEWYLKIPEYQKDLVPEIMLSIGSVNHEMFTFLTSIGLVLDPPQQLSIYITRLPLRGELYQVMDGIRLSNSSQIPFHLNGRTIAYIPRHNEHSVLPGATYTSFDYCVTDLTTYHVSNCESETIFIVVDAVNDPPIPWSNPDIIAVDEGISSNGRQHVIELSGIDIDSDDLVMQVQIHETPLWGYLLLSVSSFRDDGLLHGTLLSDLQNTISGSRVFVEYQFMETNQVVQHGQVTDSFCFRVADTMGTWSTEKCVWIQIVPSVSGMPQSTIIILEDSVGILQLRGTDNSGRRRPIGYIMESTPSESKGLLLSAQNTRLTKGSILEVIEEYPYLHGGTVIFLPSPDYCTDSSTLDDDMLTYRVSAFVNGTVASISSSANQSIHVECTRDPLILNGPQTIYHVLTFDEAIDDSCNAYTFNASEVQPESCTRAAIISGLQVITRDTHNMKAHVTIAADNGVLTLNRNYWDEIVPIGGQEEARSIIHFLALPARLDDILSYLHYQSDVPGEDQIRVVICYGTCNGTEPKLTTGTTRLEKNDADSQVLSHIISVIVIDATRQSHESYLFGGFQWLPVPFAIGVLLLIKLKGCAREELSRHDDNVCSTPAVVDQTCFAEEIMTELSTACSNHRAVPEEPPFLGLQHCDETDEAIPCTTPLS